MEYVLGLTLEQWVEKHDGIGERLAAEAAAIIAEAAFAAYSGGKELIHRDIKPANILGGQSVAGHPHQLDVNKIKLSDFGLARLAGLGRSAHATRTLSPVVGTPGYMAAEQLSLDPDGRVSAAADVFSLGVTFVELATGDPYSESERNELARIVERLARHDLTRDDVRQLREEYALLLDPARLTSNVQNPDLRAVLRNASTTDRRSVAPTPANSLPTFDSGWMTDARKGSKWSTGGRTDCPSSCDGVGGGSRNSRRRRPSCTRSA